MDTNSILSEILTLEIQKVISSYLLKNPNLSLRSISQRDQELSREYVRRLANNEITADKLDSDKVLRLLSVISNKKKLQEVIFYFEGPISNYLAHAFHFNLEINPELSNEEILNIITSSKENCIVFTLCSSENGVSFEMLKNTLGTSGLRVAENLTAKKILERSENGYKAIDRADLFPDLNSSYKMAKFFMDYYNPNQDFSYLNYLILITGELNNLGMQEKQKLTREFHVNILKIYNNKKFNTDPIYKSFEVLVSDAFNPNGDSNE